MCFQSWQEALKCRLHSLVAGVDADKTRFGVKTNRLLLQEETLTHLSYWRESSVIQARSTTHTPTCTHTCANTHRHTPCRARPSSTNLCFLSPPSSICHNTPVHTLPTHNTAYCHHCSETTRVAMATASRKSRPVLMVLWLSVKLTVGNPRRGSAQPPGRRRRGRKETWWQMASFPPRAQSDDGGDSSNASRNHYENVWQTAKHKLICGPERKNKLWSDLYGLSDTSCYYKTNGTNSGKVRAVWWHVLGKSKGGRWGSAGRPRHERPLSLMKSH